MRRKEKSTGDKRRKKMGRKRKPKRAANGEGSFRYLDSGRLECRITYRDVYGRNKRKAFSGNDEEEILEKIE